MAAKEDIRSLSWIDHDDIVGLNFIRDQGRYHFRQHHRQGLRSAIMEVIAQKDVQIERTGSPKGGMRWYPRATPKKMLRIFRTHFDDVQPVFAEIQRIQTMERYLTTRHMTVSQEFIVHYHNRGRWEIVLCGLQAYVDGSIIDPWGRLPAMPLKEARAFIDRIKQLAAKARLIPDLAGIGNLMLTRKKELVLVDINNVSDIHFDDRIRLDEKGYPVCDKSVEALAILERTLCKRAIDREEPLYAHFLEAQRMQQVADVERRFRRKLK
jgi:hypothetical protein